MPPQHQSEKVPLEHSLQTGQGDQVNYLQQTLECMGVFAQMIAHSQQSIYNTFATLLEKIHGTAPSSGNPPSIKLSRSKGNPKDVESFLFSIEDGLTMQQHVSPTTAE